tara:strand:- start:178 stop:1107 length:930 start_codon:yes stop_codon:yes gene_type:complete
MLITRKLKRYARRFDEALERDYLSGYNHELNDVLKYALTGGKRMRPAIIYDILHTMGKNDIEIDGSNIAFMTELIHTSSLIIDDLPCMDNDDMRRGRETVHKRYGLLAAKMVSTLLISDSHSMLFRMYENVKGNWNGDDLEDRILLVLDNITTNIGIEGAAYGQYLDMLPKYSNEFTNDIIRNEVEKYNREETIQEIVEKKTGVIFEIAFVSAYIFGGGDLKKIQLVKMASHYFGTVFQIYDDFLDEVEDRQRMVNDLTPNYVIRFGREHTLNVMKKSILEFRIIMRGLGLYSKFFNDLMLYLYRKTRD